MEDCGFMPSVGIPSPFHAVAGARVLRAGSRVHEHRINTPGPQVPNHRCDLLWVHRRSGPLRRRPSAMYRFTETERVGGGTALATSMHPSRAAPAVMYVLSAKCRRLHMCCQRTDTPGSNVTNPYLELYVISELYTIQTCKLYRVRPSRQLHYIRNSLVP